MLSLDEKGPKNVPVSKDLKHKPCFSLNRFVLPSFLSLLLLQFSFFIPS